jgi:hypothetical protein
MLEFDARILTPPIIRSGLHYQANVDNGTIFLGGHIFTPKLISNLAITYFGPNFEQDNSTFNVFADTLINVSFLLMKELPVEKSHKEVLL